MMNNSKRSDGRRLILVIALIGILSTYGTSAQNVQVTNSDDATTEESLDSTVVAGAQSTVEGADTSESQEVTTGASAGETATSPGETLPEATGDGQTGNIVGETSIAGEGTVETPTSVGESSTDQVRTGGVEAGVESSAGGTEGGTTATVGEASSAGATGTEIQLTVGETTATLTTSTDGAEDGPLGAVQQEEETTGTTTAEEIDTSVKQTSKAADAQYTTNVEDKSTERQTETTASIKVTVAAVTLTIASTGCGSKQSCVKCDTIETKASSADRPQWTISVSVWEAESKFYAEFVFENQRDSNQRGVLRKNRTRKYNCTNEVNRLATRLRGFKKSNASAPMPSPTPSPSPDRIIQRKRRQADQPTTSAPSDGRIIVNVDIDFDDLKNLLTASINDDDDDEDTSNSNENSSQSSAESGTASGTASTTLTVAGCGSKQSCGKCQTIRTKASSADRPQWTISGSVWEAEGKYYSEFVIENQRNPNQREILKKNRTQRKYNCPNEVNRHVTRLRGFKKSNASAPMPSTTPTPRPTVPIERKRRQADQATTSAPSDEFIEVEVDIDFDDLKVLLRGSINDDDDEEDTSDSIENTSHSSAESGTASGTASTALTVGKNEPSEVLPKSVVDQTQPESKNVWDAHRGIFLTVLIIISVCVVVTGFCCLVMKCRERGQNRNSEKQPIAMEEAREAPTSASNPIPDHEMIQDEAPMQERENPAVTPNGGGQHISKADEDNGWVVPLDELSNAEKEKPEVENTRL